MDSSYSIAVKGTSEHRLMLWGLIFPTLEINVEDSSALPVITMIGYSGMGEVIRICFNEDAELGVSDNSYNGPLHPQAHGWRVAVTEDMRLIVEDPQSLYRLEFSASECGLAVSLTCLSKSCTTLLKNLSKQSLEKQYAWPAFNTQHLATSLTASM